MRSVAMSGLAVALAAGAILLLLWVSQRRLIYLPATGGALPRPAAVGLPDVVDVVLRTDDGLTLGAWFVPSSTPGASWTLILFNGNAGHRGFRAPLASRLSQFGVSVLMCDYRGYGQ